MQKILIAEKHKQFQGFYEKFCQENRYEPIFSTGLKDTLRSVVDHSPDFVILNLMRPNQDGLEVCRRIRANGIWKDLPILFVSEAASEEERIDGFEAGCDDYLAIPFEPDELRWRLKAIERRCNPPVDLSTILQVGDVVVDTVNFTVHVQGKEVSLSSREFRLLAHLMRRKGIPQTRDTLLNQIWDSPLDEGKFARFPQDFSESKAVNVQVDRLRKKLRPADDILRVARRFGYVVRDPDEEEE